MGRMDRIKGGTRENLITLIELLAHGEAPVFAFQFSILSILFIHVHA
jgi:hypothetical protein